MNDSSNISRGGFVLDGVGWFPGQSIVAPRRGGSVKSFFRSAANLFNVNDFRHIGGFVRSSKAGSWKMKSDSPPFF
jgi:hypothetical protein